jgi:hypothetical protein
MSCMPTYMEQVEFYKPWLVEEVQLVDPFIILLAGRSVAELGAEQGGRVCVARCACCIMSFSSQSWLGQGQRGGLLCFDSSSTKSRRVPRTAMCLWLRLEPAKEQVFGSVCVAHFIIVSRPSPSPIHQS